MSNPKATREYVDEALRSKRLAVLATEGGGQPHASLIAVTPFKGFRQLLFATYRNTRKFRNLALNSKVAVLIEGGDDDRLGSPKGYVITAYGHAEEIDMAANDKALKAHLHNYPDLLSFMGAADCALILMKVDDYQVVTGIDNVMWWSVDDLEKI